LILIPVVLFAWRSGLARGQESGEVPPDSEHYQLRDELGV